MILLQQLAHSFLEPLINNLLKDDASAEEKLNKLNGKSFSVQLTNLSIQLKLSVNEQKLYLSSNIEGADCKVVTTTDQLKQLSDASQLTKLIKEDKLELEGDLAIAQAFSGLLMDNDINWQNALAKYVGDGMAYRIMEKVEHFTNLIRNKSTDANYTASSLLTDELKVAPTEQEVTLFSNQVDDLAAKVDRFVSTVNTIREITLLTRLRRIGQIFHIFFYYRLYDLIPAKLRPWYFNLVITLLLWYPAVTKSNTSGSNLKTGLEKLGPVWIKLGQMLSTRKDLLTEDLSQELTKLQDKISPFPGNQAEAIIKRQLNLNNLDELFVEFESTPIATASIAQVHGAKLTIDDEVKSVVVKVIRPNIKKQILADVSLMHMAAKWAANNLKEGHRFRPVEVVKEYEATILNELNLTVEASNGIQLRENFLGSDDLYIPEIYQQYSTSKVLIMERIDGIPVSDVEQIRQQGSDLKKLAERGVRLFFTQVFRDSFFHADMHPGNIFISKQRPEDPRYIGIDFGIIGTLNAEDKRYLAENFVAFFNRDYLKVAELHVQSGWVPSHVNVEQFEMAIRAVCDPIFNKPLEEISFAQVLIGLFDTARQFEMQVQPQLVLLQKTLLYVEGLGRQLYPKLDLWDTAKPFIENWVNEQIGFKAFVNKTKQNFPYWLEQAPQIPELIHSGLTTINKLPSYKQELIEEYKALQKQNHRFLTTLSLCSLSIMASVLTLLFSEYSIWGQVPIATIPLMLSAIFGVKLLKWLK